MRPMKIRSHGASIAVAAWALTAFSTIAPAVARSEVVINPPTRPQTASTTSREQKNLAVAMKLRHAVATGNSAQFKALLTEGYVEHDPNRPVTGARPPRLAGPATGGPVVRGAKGDFVWLVFEEKAVDPRDPTRSYHFNNFDLFRLSDGKVAEHWSSNKRGPGASPAPPPAGSAPSGWNLGVPSEGERRNVALATSELKDMLQYGHLELADTGMAPNYIQHNPYVPQGREGFKQYMARPASRPPEDIRPEWKSAPILTVAKGPFVLMMWNVNDKDPADPAKRYIRNHFDLLRVTDGQVQEHWDEARIEHPMARANDSAN